MRALRFPLRALLTGALLILLATTGRAASAENLVTCDELPMQPADGVHVNGVRFYTYNSYPGGGGGGEGAPSLDSTYGARGPGITAYVQDPSIVTYNDYDYIVLGMEFDTPTKNLQFGIGLNDFGTFPVGALVDLYDASENYLGTLPITTSSVFTFTEGLFNYSGPAIKFAEVYINPYADAYAVDNIRFGNLVTRTQGAGEGIAAFDGTRFTTILNARATSLTGGTGSLLLVAGNGRGLLRSTRFNTVMLFGNRAVVTGTAVLQGVGNVRFAAEVIDGGPRPPADRITIAVDFGEGGGTLGPLQVTSGDFRVR